MNNRQTTCDPRRIERFLGDGLDGDERNDFEEHLDACDACRRELDARAAEPDLWREARELLGSSQAVNRDSFPLDEENASGGDLTTETDAVLAALAPTDDPARLGRLGGYEIAGVIGRGGMGVVLKGFDAALNRYVAIKVLAPHLATSGAARQRFAREAAAAAAVVHENVVAIYSVAEGDRLPYFVMPYIRGASLQKRIDRDGPLRVEEILRIGRQVAAGLEAAHAQGLVHRDIKPANILLTGEVERVKITDFGLARAADDASLTRTGVIAGTPQFMSPEQARGDNLDARSDLFSLGSVLYALAAGRPPFRAETSYGVLRRITDRPARPLCEINPDIPLWLDAIIEKLHAKEVDQRFSSAGEVAKLLEGCLAHLQQSGTVALPVAVSKLATLKHRRRKAGSPRWPITRRWLVSGIAVACLISVGAVLAIQSRLGHDGENKISAPAQAAPAVDISTALDWNDGIEQQIDDLRDTTDRLQRRAERPWEETPMSSTSYPKSLDEENAK